MGIEDVNDDTSLLPNVELDLLVKDTQCLTATAVKVGKGPHLFKSDWHDATDRPKDTVKASLAWLKRLTPIPMYQLKSPGCVLYASVYS